ncbi:MAG TPA: glycosyltransferase, partial [Burkholderiales bacterium]|nr:glycosyltransferase [Burkholderiales bacterium]
LPVLATAVGGNLELVQAGVTGTLVPRDDPENMARAMLAYAENGDLCKGQGLEARRAVVGKFSMDAMVNAYMSVYDQVLSGAARRARI